MSREDEQQISGGDKVEELEAEISKLKRSLKRKANRKLFGCFSCSISLLFIFLFFALFGAYILAKSGLKEVPLFSKWFYQEPQPAYLVEVDKNIGTDIWSIIKKNASTEALLQQKNENIKFTFDLSDAQLTQLVREKINEEASLKKKIDFFQIAVLPDNLEVFIQTKEPKQLYVILNILPKVKDGKINFEVNKFRLGNLSLPNFLGNYTFVYLTEISLNNVLNLVSKIGQIEQIGLDQGVVTVQIMISNLKDLLKL
jgi:hypothetical protein